MHRLKQLFGRSETPNIGENSGDVFQYTPLKEPSNFRILCLHNSFMGANRDHKGLALRGSLIEASIHSPPKYFALSYCWGDPALSEEIILDGQILNVTASCASALRRMLRGKLGRHIWVDSICINQSITPEALKERSTQVEMMDRIYRHATQVNVYLGDGDAASDVACRSIRELFLAAVAASLSGSTQGALRRKYDRLADDVLTETPEFPYGKLHGVFRLPWFRRTWVVQEVALAKQVVFYCGNYLLNFEMMIIATDFTRVPYSNLDTNVLARHWRSYIVYHNRVKEMISWREKHEPTAKLTSLLSLLMVPGQLLEAARPEDKIFALYGICKRLGYELPAPDYQKPLAVVYTEAAKAVLHYDQSLELLSGVVESSAWADGLPSWVPNLSGCMTRWSRSSLPQLVASPPRESLKSLGLPKCEYLLDLDSTGLKVKGRRLDRICAVGKPWTLEANTTMLGGSAKNQAQYVDSLIGCIGSWLAVITGHNDSPTGKATIEHMARVLTNNLRDEYPAVPFDDMVRFLAILIGMSSSENDMRFALLASLPGGSLNPSQAEITGLIAGCHRVITRIYGSIWQTMFRTVRHYVGMGPHSLKVGDIVVLLHGCATAGVVRPSTGGFRYVGPAYVDGIMDMDFWNSGSESDDEWFTLI